MIDNGRTIKPLPDEKWVMVLAFITNITCLHELCAKLQRKRILQCSPVYNILEARCACLSLLLPYEAIKIQSVNTQFFITVNVNSYMFRQYKAAIIRSCISEIKKEKLYS